MAGPRGDRSRRTRPSEALRRSPDTCHLDGDRHHALDQHPHPWPVPAADPLRRTGCDQLLGPLTLPARLNGGPTVADLAEGYLEEHVAVRLKPRDPAACPRHTPQSHPASPRQAAARGGRAEPGRRVPLETVRPAAEIAVKCFRNHVQMPPEFAPVRRNCTPKLHDGQQFMSGSIPS